MFFTSSSPKALFLPFLALFLSSFGAYAEQESQSISTTQQVESFLNPPIKKIDSCISHKGHAVEFVLQSNGDYLANVQENWTGIEHQHLPVVFEQDWSLLKLQELQPQAQRAYVHLIANSALPEQKLVYVGSPGLKGGSWLTKLLMLGLTLTPTFNQMSYAAPTLDEQEIGGCQIVGSDVFCDISEGSYGMSTWDFDTLDEDVARLSRLEQELTSVSDYVEQIEWLILQQRFDAADELCEQALDQYGNNHDVLAKLKTKIEEAIFDLDGSKKRLLRTETLLDVGFTMPTAHHLAKMSLLAYQDEPNTDELPAGWQVFATSKQLQTNSKLSSSYFGLAFYNAKTQEMVIAHRGTKLSVGQATWDALRSLAETKDLWKIAGQSQNIFQFLSDAAQSAWRGESVGQIETI